MPSTRRVTFSKVHIEEQALQEWTCVDSTAAFLKLQFYGALCVLWQVFFRNCVGGRTRETLLAGLPWPYKGSKVFLSKAMPQVAPAQLQSCGLDDHNQHCLLSLVGSRQQRIFQSKPESLGLCSVGLDAGFCSLVSTLNTSSD